MKQDIQQFDNFISSESLNLILDEALNATEEQWALFNEKQNGPFWDNKRLITNKENAEELTNKSNEIFTDKYNITICNKVQRFFHNDILGPLVDSAFNSNIKYGSILFLNDVGYIEFPEIKHKVMAKKNTFVLYPSDKKYQIVCDKPETMYLITLFFTQT